MKRHASSLWSAKGAKPYQPGATPQERWQPQPSGLKARAIRLADGSGLQPSHRVATDTQGVALGWYGAGALPLGMMVGESVDVQIDIRGMRG